MCGGDFQDLFNLAISVNVFVLLIDFKRLEGKECYVIVQILMIHVAFIFVNNDQIFTSWKYY